MSDAAPVNKVDTKGVFGARLWLVILLIGLLSEAFALAVFTPGTFIVFAMIGVPMCLAAAVYFGVLGLRALSRQGLL